MRKGLLILSSIALVVLGYTFGAASIFTTFGTITMQLSDDPMLNRTVNLDIIVTSEIDAPETEIQVKLPAGIVPVNSTTAWMADLKPGQPQQFTLPIQVISEGIWEISASAMAPKGQYKMIGLGTIVLKVDASSGEVTTFQKLVIESQTREEPMTEELMSFVENPLYFDPDSFVVAEGIYEEPYSDDNDTTSRGCDGYITVRGYFYYYDEWGNLAPVVNASTYIYDDDFGGDDLLASTITDWNGHFEVSGIRNCDCWGCSTLDVYVKFKIWNTRFRVYYDGDDDVYTWRTATRDDVPAGIVDFGGQAVPYGDGNKKAVWIFQDMNQGWNYGTIYGHDPGDIRCLYPISDADYAYTSGSAAHPARIYISPKASDEREVVVHEYGHALLKNAGLSLPGGGHNIYMTLSEGLAFSEGWAHFYAFTVWNSPIIDVDPDDFWPMSADYVNRNCETFAHVDGYQYDFPEDVPTGATNEVRVAGGLWDIRDYYTDGYDHYGYGFGTLYDIVWSDRPMDRLYSFWQAWKGPSRYGAPSYGAHGGVIALYNNTIDYNARPVFSPTSENVNIYSLPANNVLSLNSYISDAESPDSYLDLSISSTVPGGNPFLAAIDGSHYLDFNSSFWYGDGSVTITADDEVETATNSLVVNAHIAPVPPTPTLAYPPNSSSTTDRTPTLRWHPVNGAGVDQYQLWVDDDPNFGSPYQYGGITDTFYTTLTLGLDVWYWKVRAHNSTGWGNWSSAWSLTVYESSGCPVLYSYDGTGYRPENPLLTACEKSGYADIVTDYYHVTKPLALVDGRALFQLREGVDEITYLHELELITVDHSPDVRVACALDGSITAFTETKAPLSAVDNYGIDRLDEVSAEDGNLFVASEPGYLILTFDNPGGDPGNLIIGALKKPPIEIEDDPGSPKVLPGTYTGSDLTIEILDANGNWVDLSADVPLRETPNNEMISLETFGLSSADILTVRISWSRDYATDVVGQTLPSDEALVINRWRNDAGILRTAGSSSEEAPTFGMYKPLALHKGDVFQFGFATDPPSASAPARDYIIRAVGRYEPDYAVFGNTRPMQYQLYENYPNPFNPMTTIAYDLPEAAEVRIDVFNILGQLVRTLVDATQEAGRHQVTWDSRDNDGAPVASGVYLYRLTAGTFTDSKRMVLIK